MYSIWFTGYFKCLIPVNSMKLPGEPWNNRWSSFYGIAWNFSMEFNRKCPNPPWKMSLRKFPWNSMGNVLILHANIFHGNLWRNFHGNWCPNPPWRIFHGNPSNSTEVFHTRHPFMLLVLSVMRKLTMRTTQT